MINMQEPLRDKIKKYFLAIIIVLIVLTVFFYDIIFYQPYLKKENQHQSFDTSIRTNFKPNSQQNLVFFENRYKVIEKGIYNSFKKNYGFTDSLEYVKVEEIVFLDNNNYNDLVYERKVNLYSELKSYISDSVNDMEEKLMKLDYIDSLKNELDSLFHQLPIFKPFKEEKQMLHSDYYQVTFKMKHKGLISSNTLIFDKSFQIVSLNDFRYY